MLKSLFKEAGINAKEAIVAIPLRGSFLTTIKLPKIDEKEMDAMVKFEARKFIPVMIEEIEFDWWVLPPSLKNTARQSQSSPQQLVDAGSPQKAGEMVDVLIVAIQKDLLNKYRQVVSSAGLGTVRFEIEIFSSIRSCIFRQTSPVMIIDFGASSTKFSIVDYGVLRTTPHSVDRGTQMLTSSIAKSMNISFGRAEEMKLQVGLSSRPEHKELVSVMEPTLNYIFSEGRQMMNIFKNKTGETVGKVILSGGGALLGNITDMAVKNLGVECVTADPFAKAQYAPFLQEVLKQIGPSFSCAAGLALREV
jgi:type IV pilus assembly protein PilM